MGSIATIYLYNPVVSAHFLGGMAWNWRLGSLELHRAATVLVYKYSRGQLNEDWGNEQNNPWSWEGISIVALSDAEEIQEVSMGKNASLSGTYRYTGPLIAPELDHAHLFYTWRHATCYMSGGVIQGKGGISQNPSPVHPPLYLFSTDFFATALLVKCSPTPSLLISSNILCTPFTSPARSSGSAGPLPAQRILHWWSTRYVYPTLLFSKPIDSRISSVIPLRTTKYLSQLSFPTRPRSDHENSRTSHALSMSSSTLTCTICARPPLARSSSCRDAFSSGEVKVRAWFSAHMLLKTEMTDARPSRIGVVSAALAPGVLARVRPCRLGK